jgi:hypothetical protein
MSSRSVNASHLLASTAILLCFSSQILSSAAFVVNSAVGMQRRVLSPHHRAVIKAFPLKPNVKVDSTSEPDGSTSQDANEVSNRSLLRLAKLSLEDYKWRISVFKTEEADRRVEESLARMMGDEASYVRPMDASKEKIGPLVSVFPLLGSFFFSPFLWTHIHICFIGSS